ncbi:MAG: M20/M25/M40 family metallo-hydrolase [Nocardia sp.]|nr:M20/M25/M40 family metallo-hydrolase [Nocardia sp.]
MTTISPLEAGVDDRTAERLARALRCVTVSRDDTETDVIEFDRLAQHLETSFPLVHTHLELERFGHSRLYRWAGTEAGTAAILLAHQDVVPVDDESRWTHPPFAGVVDEKYIWGRGAIDDKSRVLAILEATEELLAQGRRPRRTIYVAFGHDEEVFGCSGAARMAERLRERRVGADLLLDEGGVITDGVVDDATTSVATIMIGEKGWATVRLHTTDAGGHSSMPAGDTAVGRIARAVARVQDQPMPLRMTPVIADMLTRSRSALRQPRRTALRLLPIAGPVIARIMTGQPQTEAMVRTTTAPTVIRGGVKANVLPQSADALVNFRILPGDSVADVLAHCVRVIGDDRVRVELSGPSSEPTGTAKPGPAHGLIADITRELAPDATITTGLVPGATDSRYYDELATTRCNFAPIVVDAADLARIHGTDERLSRVNYARLIEFNRRLLTHYTDPGRS